MIDNKKEPLAIEESILTDFNEIYENMKTLKSQITIINNKIKDVENKCKKREKMLVKQLNKSKNKGNRKPTGFAAPSNISVELCNFMGVDEGTKIARTEVTKYISKYIKDNKLQGKENKKIIKPDKNLESLLNVKEGDDINFFSIQKYMNKHFVTK